jgi:hypothetical protein
VGKIVRFGARIANTCFDNAPGGHIKTGNQGLGAVTAIFKLLPFALTGSHRLVWGTPFQGLNASHLIYGEGSLSALSAFYRTQVEVTDIFDLFIKLRVGGD